MSGALSGYQAYVVTIVVIFTVIGASHTILFGAAGQPSVGHAALLGAGVYAAVAVGRTGLGMEVELVAGVVVGAVIGVLIGLPSLRIGSLYLAIATLALCVVAQQVFFEWDDLTGGGAGIQIPPPTLFGTTYTPLGLLYIALAVAGICLLVARNCLRGRQGRAWHALRTSPLAASSLGMSLGWQKVGAFGVSGAMVGCAGVLYAHAINYVSPSDFTLDLSIITLVVAIIGGQRYLWGAALGAIFVEGVPELLRATGEFRYIIYGAVFVVIMLFFPEGFAGGIATAWRRWGPGRRRGAPATVDLLAHRHDRRGRARHRDRQRAASPRTRHRRHRARDRRRARRVRRRHRRRRGQRRHRARLRRRARRAQRCRQDHAAQRDLRLRARHRRHDHRRARRCCARGAPPSAPPPAWAAPSRTSACTRASRCSST